MTRKIKITFKENKYENIIYDKIFAISNKIMYNNRLVYIEDIADKNDVEVKKILTDMVRNSRNSTKLNTNNKKEEVLFEIEGHGLNSTSIITNDQIDNNLRYDVKKLIKPLSKVIEEFKDIDFKIHFLSCYASASENFTRPHNVAKAKNVCITQKQYEKTFDKIAVNDNNIKGSLLDNFYSNMTTNAKQSLVEITGMNDVSFSSGNLIGTKLTHKGGSWISIINDKKREEKQDLNKSLK